MRAPKDDALARQEPGVARKPGPGAPQSPGRIPWPGQGPAAFKSRPPVLPNPGPRVWFFGDRVMRFIPPLALFNDADQWVNLLSLVRPMTAQQNPDSNPILKAQYFTPPPINVSANAAGALNLQLQLGNISIQAARLTTNAQNYFGPS